MSVLSLKTYHYRYCTKKGLLLIISHKQTSPPLSFIRAYVRRLFQQKGHSVNEKISGHPFYVYMINGIAQIEYKAAI